jgi:hypothetical protein
MHREQVSSSNIKSIGYESNSKTLEIEFRDGGIYQYFNVTSNIYEELISTPSIGSFFHKYIKENYNWKKIN